MLSPIGNEHTLSWFEECLTHIGIGYLSLPTAPEIRIRVALFKEENPIPIEVFRLFFTGIPYKALVRASLVCKSWAKSAFFVLRGTRVNDLKVFYEIFGYKSEIPSGEQKILNSTSLKSVEHHFREAIHKYLQIVSSDVIKRYAVDLPDVKISASGHAEISLAILPRVLAGLPEKIKECAEETVHFTVAPMVDAYFSNLFDEFRLPICDEIVRLIKLGAIEEAVKIEIETKNVITFFGRPHLKECILERLCAFRIITNRYWDICEKLIYESYIQQALDYIILLNNEKIDLHFDELPYIASAFYRHNHVKEAIQMYKKIQSLRDKIYFIRHTVYEHERASYDVVKKIEEILALISIEYLDENREENTYGALLCDLLTDLGNQEALDLFLIKTLIKLLEANKFHLHMPCGYLRNLENIVTKLKSNPAQSLDEKKSADFIKTTFFALKEKCGILV